MSDASRAGAEERDRARRLRKYGTELCLTCGRHPKGSLIEEAFRQGDFPHIELIVSDGRPEPGPDFIVFCSEACREDHKSVAKLADRVANILGGTPGITPAFRINLRRRLERALRETEIPSV